MKIKKVKKGMTLIEVLISIAILGILIVPLSSMVLTSVSINRMGKEKQQGTNVAQKVLEQIKIIDEPNIEDLYNNIRANFPSREIGTNELKLYYDEDGSPATQTNYKYLIDLTLSERTHNVVNDIVFNNNIQVNDSTLIAYNNHPEVSISDELKVVVNDENETNLEMIINGVAYDLSKQNPDIAITFGKSFTNTNDNLRIVVENNSSENLNIYINKKKDITANYTIVNSLGRVNQFFNYEDNASYDAINNSVKLDLTTYVHNNQSGQDKKIAHVEGYRNLGE
ncbi:type IV pilus modification PilV family protein [Clostridium paridis]|uniref:Type II secretion system protein n=1 Tax=Clostridium paridis TaxID=2803863 RepID=A0A937K659_9CLOT|nr:type II secretion system protein [Clostridium paridis]MBL4933358.1 type II secretion system protein [Clostridium paridis]